MKEDGVSIVFAPQVYTLQIEQLQAVVKEREREIYKLRVQLEYEQGLRKKAEEELANNQLQHPEQAIEKPKITRKKVDDGTEYCEFKSDGKRKARPADAIRSYDDFVAIQNYYLSKNNIRDWTLWTVGVSLGLRISDLLSLRIHNILNEDHSFKQRIQIYEQKTGKANNCLITESVVYAVTRYFDSISWSFGMDDFLFASRKTKEKMYEEYGWKILSDAGKALRLPLVIGSHTMRKSFANIAACVDKSSIDMNTITKVQGLLNHSDQKCTMRYLGSFREMYDRARIAVSDFVLGKTNINELLAGNSYSMDDLMEKLDALEEKILTKE